MSSNTPEKQTFSSRKKDGEIVSDEIILLQPIIDESEEEEAEPAIDWSTYDWGAFKEDWHIRDYTLREVIDVSDADHIPANEVPFQPRNRKVTIRSGGLPEQINPYLRKLILLTGGPNGRVGLQFIADPVRESPKVPNPNYVGSDDSLIEDEHEVNGVVNKYGNRVLVITTGACVAYCRFCTRGRLVGTPEEKAKSKEEIDLAFTDIENDPNIQELIFSGGDPFTLPPEIFEYVVDKIIYLQKKGQIRSVRFGTRALIHSGEIKPHILKQLERFKEIKRPPHIMVHVNTPEEITTKVVDGFNALIMAGAKLYSQTVILAGVNDNKEVMEELFTKLDEYGVTPYYAFTCDPTAWAEKFKVPLKKVREIFWQFRKNMTGVAGMVRVVIDVPGGHGKITLEEGFWISETRFQDFKGEVFEFDEYDNIRKVSKEELELELETQSKSIKPKETVLFQSAADYG